MKRHRQLTHEYLRQFQGDLKRYRHTLNRHVIYTPGVQYLAESGEAYWLLDAIAFNLWPEDLQAFGELDYRILEMHFWSLEVVEETGLLSAWADKGCKPFVQQYIPHIDFPLDYVEIWAAKSGADWTLYLPSEH